MFNGEAFGKEMTDVVRGYVERAIAPLALLTVLALAVFLLPRKQLH
jgi:hypothetical protein